jgi:hypothetical protein
MDQRTTHLLTGIMLLGVAFTALPQAISFAQSDPFVGTWQLNVAKSEYNFGRPPKAQTLNVQGEGQNRKATLAGLDAAGNPFTRGFMFIHDSKPHPVTGATIDPSMIIPLAGLRRGAHKSCRLAPMRCPATARHSR